MKRIEGHIDLCAILDIPNEKESYEFWLEVKDRLYSNKDVEILKFDIGLNILFSFMYEGEKYFFSYDSLSTPLDELFVDFIYDDLGVKHVDYDMACIGGLKGTLSKDYKVSHAKYLNGREILIELVDYELDKLLVESYGFEEARLREASRYNSLEGIRCGLEKRYGSESLIVERLMSEIVKIFIVDVITGQRDRHFDNWQIIEHEDSRVEMQPLFDNSRAFVEHPIMCRMALSVNNLNEKAPRIHLEQNAIDFMNQARSEFVQQFLDSIWVLRPENIDRVIVRIESKIGSVLDDRTKLVYKEKTDIQLEYLKEILNLRTVEVPKRIKFEKQGGM